MNWPEEIRIKVLQTAKNKNVGNIVLFVTVLAPRKNNYSLGLFMTDKNNEIVIKKKKIKNKIEETNRDYPMDYSESLETCDMGIEINLPTRHSFSSRIHAADPFYPETTKKYKTILKGDGIFAKKDITYIVTPAELNKSIVINVEK